MGNINGFERYFRAISYLVALTGLFALFSSGGIGLLSFAVFLFAYLISFLIEGTKHQLSERLAVVVVGASVVWFFVDWRFRITGVLSGDLFAASGLAFLILFLSVVKLAQKKTNKDWIFIYLITFFEVLLAAGLSISPLYLVTLFSFLFTATCAIIAFEIRKSLNEGQDEASGQNTGIKRVATEDRESLRMPRLRLPAVSIILLTAITLVGLPVFFTLPRGNAAGLGQDMSGRVNITGFSDSVNLGTIGTLQQSDEIVMRVRIDRNNNENLNRLLWRGVALDRFDNLRWTKSTFAYRQQFVKNAKNFVLFDHPLETGRATIQTFYLEPLNTNVLFALRRPFAVQGVGRLDVDAEGALLGSSSGNQRTTYQVQSDTLIPPVSKLRSDQEQYSRKENRYLQVPENLDPRIAELAKSYIEEAGATNKYDIAETIEARLSGDFGYSLEMKARGPQPVADFLFNVKEGHCEYFASAMAMMLRTQGVAARVVNGFQSGDYNETAGMFIVRQRNAHSWVEVYFPETNAWVEFDPTPPDANAGSSRSSFMSAITGYIEALEAFWIQYVVAYDGQEQKSLFRSFRDSLQGYMATGTEALDSTSDAFGEWFSDLKGDEGVVAGAKAAGIGLLVLVCLAAALYLLNMLKNMLLRLRLFGWIKQRLWAGNETETIVFYQQMSRLLQRHGLNRESWQTPVEFASDVGIPEVASITKAYNRVRFGMQPLTDSENKSIARDLESIAEKLKKGDSAGNP
ncbi:MAG: DUF3488 domain-containing protein [Pyrinomonadaceae bacterium]|nr:DUF3488 domain-containing protein [Pyrinomonadaceae bacterium]